MRVLVITRAPWRDDNNTGNTLSNFFGNMKDFEFYNLYFRNQNPMNDVAVKSFYISESQIIKNILGKSEVGSVVTKKDIYGDSEDRLYVSAKKHGSNLLMLLRDALWSVGRWKSKNLIDFLNEVKPDIIFTPVFNCCYPHKILKFVKKQTEAKVILFHADDNYTLKQFSFSPIFWIYRLILRKWVRRSVNLSDINYVISNLQREEYANAFNKPFKVLTKSINFSDKPQNKAEYNNPIQLVFTGNININRWKSLAHIANVLEKINADCIKAQLRIYTGNTLTDEMKAALNIGESSFVMGRVPAEKVAEIQKNADMLVHVEALNIKSKLTVRQSFSTKIVDYLAAARPILAFGPKDVASIDHFIKNDCAIVADNEEELLEKLSKVISNKDNLDELARQAFACGRKNHNKKDIDKMLREDFYSLI